MTASVAHPFHSAVSDGSDASLVRPSNWNADHTVTGYQESAEKGAASGYAPLDSGILVPIAYLPTGTGAAQVALGNHGHGGTPAVVLGASASAGSASTLVRTDDTIAAFDATAPTTQAFGDSAVVGTAAKAARRDHKHAMPANPAASFASPTIVLDSSAAGGAASTVIRSDATIAAFDATSPTTQTYSDSPAVGSAAFAARRDHKHGMPASAGASFATPAVVLGSSAAAGAAGTVIRSDSTIAAFDATAPVTQAFSDSAAVGTAAFAARRDHKHGMPANPGGSSWTEITKSSDQTVTADATLASDSELTFGLATLGIYMVELWIAYSNSDTSGDYAGQVTTSANTIMVGFHTEFDATNTQSITPIRRDASTWPSSAFTGAAGASSQFSFIIAQLMIYNYQGTTTTLTYKFACSSPAGDAKTRAGSMLRYRKLN